MEIVYCVFNNIPCLIKLMKPKFSKRTITILSFILAWMIAISIGLYFRSFPLKHFSSNKSSEKATLLVLYQLRMKLAAQVGQTYPHLSKEEKDILTQKLFDNTLRNEKKNVLDTIQSISAGMDKFSGEENNTPYLLASDSFYYYDLTRRIVRKGALSDSIKGSKFFNKKMIAPDGFWEPLNLHPYVGFIVYSVAKLFSPNIELMYAVSFTPLVITFLSSIAFVLITIILGCRPLYSFAGTVYFLLAPIFIKRSTFGWYDNDPYNIFFPLLIFGLLFYGLSSFSKRKRLLISGIAIPISIAVYSLFWQGWMYIFGVIILSALIMLSALKFLSKNKSNFRPLLFFYGIISLGSFALIGLIMGFTEFFVLFAEGWKALNNFLAPQLSAWPDLFLSVGELKSASPAFIVKMTGGIFFVIVSLFGFIHYCISSLRKEKKNAENPFIALVLGIFLATSFVIASGALRFTVFCLIPLAITFPLGLQYFYAHTKSFVQKLIPSKRPFVIAANLLLVLTVLALTVIPVGHLYKTIRGLLNPIYNDTWGSTLSKIKEETPENSIVNTWWPPGHFIKAIAERRVTFDGATINFPQAYWMANVFLSPTEDQAAGILRMLNNSANRAADYLTSKDLPLSAAVKLLRGITQMSETKAKIFLTGFLKDPVMVQELISMTHSTPPPSYCLVYKELVDNNLQLPFVGNWNFKEIENINSSPHLLKKVPSRSSGEYIDFLWKLVGGSYKYSGVFPQINRSDNTVLFTNNLALNLNSMSCEINSNKFGKGIPFSVIYADENDVYEKKFAEATLAYSVVLLKEGEKYSAILCDRKLAVSLLFRLYFFQGKGLKFFKPFINEKSLTGRTHIMVFEVDWEQYFKEMVWK